MSFESTNTRHDQNEGSSVFVEVVCSSGRRCMDRRATHTSYRLFSHTLQVDDSPLPSWPTSTSVWCWHCVHPFDTVPLSIPQSVTRLVTHVYGVFCSINCAKAYLLGRPTYDQQQLMLQLNHVAVHIFKLPIEQVANAKEAPPQCFLKVFGGHLSIEEFRAKSLQVRTALITPPFVSYAMIMEEMGGGTAAAAAATEDMDTDPQPREGHHILRGLRRPTKPHNPPEIAESTEPSRFDQFVASKANTPSSVAPAVPKSRRRTPKRKIMSETGETSGNTLSGFLVKRAVETAE